MPTKATPPSPGNSATKPNPLAGSISTTMPDLSEASIHRMQLPELQSAVTVVDRICKGAYAHFGILRVAISAKLKATKSKKDVSAILREAGLSNGTISHTSYAADAYGLVQTKHLTIEEFHQLGIEVMQEMRLVCGAESKKKLNPGEMIKFIRDGLAESKKSREIADELRSLRVQGVTLAEADKKLAANAAADKKRLDDEAATEQKRVTDAAVAAALVKQTAQNAANAASGAAAPSVSATTTTTASGTPGTKAAAPGTVAPGKITTMPAAYTAVDFDKDLQAIMEKLGKAPVAQQKAAVPILEVYLALLKSSIAASEKPAAPAKPSGKPAPTTAPKKKAA